MPGRAVEDGWFTRCVCVRTRCGEGARFMDEELWGGANVEEGMSGVNAR